MKVTQELIDNLIDQAPYEEAIMWGKVVHREYKLPNGYTVPGRAACVDPAEFVLEVGQRIAHEDAKSRLWQLEGYLLADRISRSVVKP